MTRIAAALALATVLLAPLPGQAQDDALSAAEFDAYTRGKTFHYGAGDGPYGAEEYLDDRRVIWSFLDGKCKKGRWFEQDDMICFVYGDTPEPQCWSFFAGPGGLVARYQNGPAQTTLYELSQSRDPMLCLGPDVGV
ncbi:hypothetical protein [Sediminimonas sp.]|uniref:hypothetical protein n=1 Tax=Sediminimonas sp. TaxID=2823379 RepID=UPI0025E24A65|nr:hypothetical protein [Sediminimonas sp.]